jgi:hypothetical protein
MDLPLDLLLAVSTSGTVTMHWVGGCVRSRTGCQHSTK